MNQFFRVLKPRSVDKVTSSIQQPKQDRGKRSSQKHFTSVQRTRKKTVEFVRAHVRKHLSHFLYKSTNGLRGEKNSELDGSLLLYISLQTQPVC